MGRPTKLTEDLLGELCGHLENGNPISTACALVGIGESTYHKWQKRGKEEMQRVEEGHANCRIRKEEARYVEFVEATTHARAEGDRRHVQNIIDAGSEDWRASAWYLEHARPEKWSKKTKHEHMGEGGGPVQVIFDDNVPEPDDN